MIVHQSIKTLSAIVCLRVSISSLTSFLSGSVVVSRCVCVCVSGSCSSLILEPKTRDKPSTYTHTHTHSVTRSMSH